MTTHKNGIGIIFFARENAAATTATVRKLMYVVYDPDTDSPANDANWNWNEQPEANDFVNQAYNTQANVNGGHQMLIHDFGASVSRATCQDYIVNTLGFNALPEGTIFRAKTTPSNTRGQFPDAQPGVDEAACAEGLELDGDVNPVTIPTSGTQGFWTNMSSSALVCYAMIWDYRALIDTFAGKAEDAGWRFRWNDTDDRLEMSFDGVNWYPISTDGSAPTLQDALDQLASYYPTEDYDAAIDSNNIIFVRPGSGGAGTITFSSEYQTILDEENGTFVLNTGRRVDLHKWV